ncbi:MAG: hypothetical protein V1745_05120 [Patescibacteria group bacterium]
MAKDKTPRDEGSLLPIIAANILANAFEISRDPELSSAGTDVRRIGRENKGALIAFQSAVSAFIETRTGMSPNARITASKYVDTVFDWIRRMPADAPYPTQLRSLEEGGRALLALVANRSKEEKPSKFAKFESELSETDQQKLLDMNLWLLRWSPDTYDVLMDALATIDSKERLERMLKIKAVDPDEFQDPPGLDESETERSEDHLFVWCTVQRWIAFLRSSQATRPGIKEFFLSALRGEQTPQGKAFEARVKKFSASADAFAKSQSDKADEVLERNGLLPKVVENPKWHHKLGMPLILFSAGSLIFLVVLCFAVL